MRSIKLDMPYLNVEIFKRDSKSLLPGSRYGYIQNANACQSPLGAQVKVEEDELRKILAAMEKL